MINYVQPGPGPGKEDEITGPLKPCYHGLGTEGGMLSLIKGTAHNPKDGLSNAERAVQHVSMAAAKAAAVKKPHHPIIVSPPAKIDRSKPPPALPKFDQQNDSFSSAFYSGR